MEKIDELKSKIATLLLSLLEGEVDHESIQRMSRSLDFEIMKDRLLYVFHTFAKKTLDTNQPVSKISINALSNTLSKDAFEDNVNEAFEIFILLSTLADSSIEARKKIERKNFTTDQWKAFDFFKANTGRIEV